MHEGWWKTWDDDDQYQDDDNQDDNDQDDDDQYQDDVSTSLWQETHHCCLAIPDLCLNSI